MDANLTPDLINAYHTPAVRHLAWLCQAPQLLCASMTFEPLRHLPTNYRDTLKLWDRDTSSAPALLSEPPQRRLGFYFERLYQILLEDLLGWPLLMKNQQIQSHGRTIGELDFVVHNRSADRIEHHEIAIKFYLGVPDPLSTTLWYGPNARDRLDLKTSSLLEQQSRRTQHPETIELLAKSGITGPITPQIFMPGYLFYPGNQTVITPDYVSPHHSRGHWMYAHEARSTETSHWVVLNKPHWIGNWFQSVPPDIEHTQEALGNVKNKQVPQLFAVMRQDYQTGNWFETDRVFVVPEAWPVF